MSNVSITTIHHELPKVVSKQILKSMIGSLNATAIAYARGHLRFNAFENNSTAAETRGYKRPARDDEMHIDDANDAQNAIAEAKFRDEVVTPGMGGEDIMPSGVLAEKLIRVREYYAVHLLQMQDQVNDVPLTIAETVKFQMDRQPDNNDTLIEALAAAVDIDPELLKAAQIKMTTDDAADLRANAGKVITYLERFQDVDLDERAVESLVDTLPAHVQYKLMSAAIRAHDKAQQKALIALLRGKLDAAGDIKLIKGHREDLLAWLTTFSKAKRVQLDAYIERGGTLMEIEDRTIVTSESNKPSATAVPKSPMAPIGSCEVKHDEPKVIGQARRAPAPQSA